MSDTPPAMPGEGDWWLRGTDFRLFRFTDGYWVEVGSPGSGGGIGLQQNTALVIASDGSVTAYSNVNGVADFGPLVRGLAEGSALLLGPGIYEWDGQYRSAKAGAYPSLAQRLTFMADVRRTATIKFVQAGSTYFDNSTYSSGSDRRYPATYQSSVAMFILRDDYVFKGLVLDLNVQENIPIGASNIDTVSEAGVYFNPWPCLGWSPNYQFFFGSVGERTRLIDCQFKNWLSGGPPGAAPNVTNPLSMSKGEHFPIMLTSESEVEDCEFTDPYDASDLVGYLDPGEDVAFLADNWVRISSLAADSIANDDLVRFTVTLDDPIPAGSAIQELQWYKVGDAVQDGGYWKFHIYENDVGGAQKTWTDDDPFNGLTGGSALMFRGFYNNQVSGVSALRAGDYVTAVLGAVWRNTEVAWPATRSEDYGAILGTRWLREHARPWVWVRDPVSQTKVRGYYDTWAFAFGTNEDSGGTHLLFESCTARNCTYGWHRDTHLQLASTIIRNCRALNVMKGVNIDVGVVGGVGGIRDVRIDGLYTEQLLAYSWSTTGGLDRNSNVDHGGTGHIPTYGVGIEIQSAITSSANEFNGLSITNCSFGFAPSIENIGVQPATARGILILTSTEGIKNLRLSDNHCRTNINTGVGVTNNVLSRNGPVVELDIRDSFYADSNNDPAPTPADDISYTPATSVDWGSSVGPDNVAEALDELADRTAALESTPAGPAYAPTITESTTARTLGLSDAGAYIRLTHASGCTLTLPEQASVAWAADTEISFRVEGALVALTKGTGVTVDNEAALAGLRANDLFTLKRVAENAWDVIAGATPDLNPTLETLTASTGTITSNTPAITASQTWNNAAVTFTAIFANVTNTASAAASRLIDLQVGGVSQFSVTRGGVVTAAQFNVSATEYIKAVGGRLEFYRNGNREAAFDAPSSLRIYAASIYSLICDMDRKLLLQNGGIEQRSSSTAQSYQLYDTYTSATDYHRLGIATARATLSNVSGASVTATNLIPAGAVVVGVTSKVTTALGTSNGTTGYQVGTVADPDRWANKTGTAAGTNTGNVDWTNGTVECFTAATSVIVTAVGGNFNGTGVIYLSVQYLIGESD